MTNLFTGLIISCYFVVFILVISICILAIRILIKESKKDESERINK